MSGHLGVLLGACLALGCAGTETQTLTFSLSNNTDADAGALSSVKAWQVAVLEPSAHGSCLPSDIPASCLVKWSGYSAKDLAKISGADGKQADALLFPNTVTASDTTLSLTVHGLPIAEGYTTVVEAVSEDDLFLGSSCETDNIKSSGANAGFAGSSLTILKTPLSCNPLIP